MIYRTLNAGFAATLNCFRRNPSNRLEFGLYRGWNQAHTLTSLVLSSCTESLTTSPQNWFRSHYNEREPEEDNYSIYANPNASLRPLNAPQPEENPDESQLFSSMSHSELDIIFDEEAQIIIENEGPSPFKDMESSSSMNIDSPSDINIATKGFRTPLVSSPLRNVDFSLESFGTPSDGSESWHLENDPMESTPLRGRDFLPWRRQLNFKTSAHREHVIPDFVTFLSKTDGSSEVDEPILITEVKPLELLMTMPKKKVDEAYKKVFEAMFPQIILQGVLAFREYSSVGHFPGVFLMSVVKDRFRVDFLQRPDFEIPANKSELESLITQGIFDPFICDTGFFNTALINDTESDFSEDWRSFWRHLNQSMGLNLDIQRL